MIGRFFVGLCGSIFSLLCDVRQNFSGVRVAQSFVLCVMVGSLVWGSCGSIFSFLRGGWETFSGVRVAQSLLLRLMVGRLLVGQFVLLYLQFSVSWQVDYQWGSWGSIQFSVSWLVDFQWGSCDSIFSFLCYGWQIFCGVRVAQSLVFCVMLGRILVGFVQLNLLCSVSWQVDFFGVRVAQSLVFCVMVGRTLVGFVWLNLYFSVSWLVDLQWGSCCSIFRFLCHDWQTFSGVRVAQSLDFCVMFGRLLVGFVWLNLYFSESWLVAFQ